MEAKSGGGISDRLIFLAAPQRRSEKSSYTEAKSCGGTSKATYMETKSGGGTSEAADMETIQVGGLRKPLTWKQSQRA